MAVVTKTQVKKVVELAIYKLKKGGRIHDGVWRDKGLNLWVQITYYPDGGYQVFGESIGVWRGEIIKGEVLNPVQTFTPEHYKKYRAIFSMTLESAVKNK